MPERERTLVTGALGCLGAWTLKALLELGEEPVGYDLGTDERRLELVLSAEERARVTLVRGDIASPQELGHALDEHGITRVVHLAALQVPFCRADPVRCAVVNVVGTVVVFEAVRARLDRIPGLSYASSAAVYSASDPSPAPEAGGSAPTTIYGVYKIANEGTARRYWEDFGVPSIGIRPSTVYGPGRDQGLTASPSLAMAAAARSEGFSIAYGGRTQYDYAPDVGRAFALAARAAREGAHVANYPGEVASMEEIVAAIEAAAPEVAGRIAFGEDRLPFPEALEATLLERLLGPLPRTPLSEGIRETIERFRASGAT
ncbi:MAG: NAD(P)-dependent oxidoreductase [Thermoleophilia bacterium]|nr:NAD(P)-dependent oxidoreductase [Gaiellaceae bacterium]MDW8337778.1 NAD(P)-dependent oxidoreductase [Thermoleophilia bacterium]